MSSAKARGDVLYWIGTPRHFLIAAGMAVGDAGRCDSHLVLTSREDYVGGIETVLDRWSASPFSQVRTIRSPAFGASRFSNMLRERRNLERFRRMARDSEREYSEMRVFPVNWAPAQAFLYETRRASPATRRVMLEDGGILYNAQPIGAAGAGEYPRWKLAAARMLYGPAWSAISKNGNGEIVDEMQVIAPELVRGEMSGVKRVELSADHLRRLADTELPDVYLSLYGCDAQQMQGVEFAVILSRSDGLLGGMVSYAETVNALIATARRRGIRTGIKYHPKESMPDYLGLADQSDVFEIPREIPMELLFIVNPRNLRFVLGDASSALFGAPWMLPDCRAVSFVNMVDKAPELIYPNLEGFGVKPIDSLSDLERILETA